jgi:hypothetical protein
MGLLDIYNDYMKRLQGISVEDDFTGMNYDLQVPKKDSEGKVINPMLRDREGGSPLTKPGGNLFPTKYVPQNQGQLTLGNTTINLPKSVLTKEAAANQAKAIKDSKTPQAQKNQMPSDPIVMGGSGTQQADIGFMQKLANMANVDFDKAAATWKEKGGFEGLMANPAFTMGLAFMQAGAEGKSIGGAALDSVAKAAGISQQYKKLLAGKTEVLEVTEGDMNQIKNVLNAEGISAPILRKLLPGNQAEKYEQAVEDIAMAVNKKVRARVTAAKKAGKDIQVGTRLYKEIIKDMIAKGEIDKKGGLKLFGYNVIDATLEARAHGGPVHEDKAYMVGEKGPEVFIPKSSGNVVANDDTQVFSMLLAANPQLQKISKDRAMKILKAKFPEYFD